MICLYWHACLLKTLRCVTVSAILKENEAPLREIQEEAQNDQDFGPGSPKMAANDIRKYGTYNTCSHGRKRKLDRHIATLVYEAALPLDFVEGSPFKRFCHAMHPAYACQGLPGELTYLHVCTVDMHDCVFI